MSKLDNPAAFIDPAHLAAGQIPPDFPLHAGRVIVLWQTPSKGTIEYLRRIASRVPLIVTRYEVETAIHQAQIPYWTPADFFSIRAIMDFELATFDARAAYRGPTVPTYQDMPLIDGDLPRIRALRELVVCGTMLLLIQQAAPNTQIVTDWMGSPLANVIGLRVHRLWRCDLADNNWPPRRWLREAIQKIGPADTVHSPRPRVLGPRGAVAHQGTDVLIMLGGWVEQRLLDSFPIEQLVEQGHRCLLLVHRRSPALEALVERTNVRCVTVDYPPPADDVAHLERKVADWCATAIQHGYFAPLRGPLAECVNRLMAWSRWAPKLVAMHRLLTDWLVREEPRLLLAPAEKDWGPYCAHYTAKSLGIPSVGIKHASWLIGSDLDRLEYGLYYPTAAKHILAYTPADTANPVQPGKLVWCGNPRVEKCPALHPSHDREGVIISQPLPHGRGSDNVRILIGPRGMGPGRTMSLRRNVVSWNIRLIDGLLKRVGEHRVRVRLHPWNSPDEYPSEFLPIFLAPAQPLDDQLAEYDLFATTYSTISLDAAAAGLPQLIWDHERLRIEQSEIARFGGVVSSHDLNELCDAAVRFVEDAGFRKELHDRASRFPLYLRDSLPDPHASMSANLVQSLGRLGDFVHEPKEGISELKEAHPEQIPQSVV